MYIVALVAKRTGEPLIVKRNLSKQPLRFDNQAYAERLAFESNQRLPHHAQDDFHYIVMEDNRFYEEEVVIDDDF